MEGKGDKSKVPLNHRPFAMTPIEVLHSFLAFGLGTTFSVFLALKLDDEVPWHYVVVFAPMIVREVLHLFTFRMRGRCATCAAATRDKLRTFVRDAVGVGSRCASRAGRNTLTVLHAVPCGTLCRAGYRAVRDTVP